ncbi:MAG TPA: RimK family protein [Pseudomonadales bacterium]|jgi:glutathione synthase/RimK-type ligase-like ATP-grasp enzyme
MAILRVVVDSTKDWRAYYPTEQVITLEEYLALPASERGRTQVINLCRSYNYLSSGYYCALLAEARGHHVIPNVHVLGELMDKKIYGLWLPDLEEVFEKLLKERPASSDATIRFRIFFGRTADALFAKLGRRIFERFPCPILEVEIQVHKGLASVQKLKPVGLDQLSEEEEGQFADAVDRYSHSIWRKPREPKTYRYDIAMLVNPEERLPPSDKVALNKFIKAGRKLGVEVDIISPKDYMRIAEYDALFIRETTRVNDHTYRFSRKAAIEGMVVIDDPVSIMRCCNKVYLADLFHRNNVPAPKTVLMMKPDREALEKAVAQIGFPVVLKIPDGSFSTGVFKAKDMDELMVLIKQLSKQSALVLAQEFLYTPFDWRIGVMDGKPIFASRYFMARDHWQVYNHAAGRGQRDPESGTYDSMPTHEAPQVVLDVAVKASRLIGDSFYGVDIKQVDNKAYVIEVNDNPSIESGVEDGYLGDQLYTLIMEGFVRRLESKQSKRG